LHNCRWFKTTTDGDFKKKDCSERLNSKDVIISAKEKGWMNSEVLKFWLENVWRKRKMAFFNPKSLLMLDSCRAHITPEIKTIVNKYSKMAIIPDSLMKKLQPLDITVNKPFKTSCGLSGKTGRWVASMNITKQCR
jgi:hypothetical protein